MAKDCPLPDCDGALHYDTCEDCGHRVEDKTSDRTNVHLPSKEAVRRRQKKLMKL